jgi:hypothetical protein
VIGISGEVGNNKKMVESGADASFLRGNMTIRNVVDAMASLYKNNGDHVKIFHKQLRKNAKGFLLSGRVQNSYKGWVLNIKNGFVYVKFSTEDVPMIIKVKLPFVDIEGSFSDLGRIPSYFLGKTTVNLFGMDPSQEVYYGCILPTNPVYIGTYLSKVLLNNGMAKLAAPVPAPHFLDFYKAKPGLELFEAVRKEVKGAAPKK